MMGRILCWLAFHKQAKTGHHHLLDDGTVVQRVRCKRDRCDWFSFRSVMVPKVHR